MKDGVEYVLRFGEAYRGRRRMKMQPATVGTSTPTLE